MSFAVFRQLENGRKRVNNISAVATVLKSCERFVRMIQRRVLELQTIVVKVFIQRVFQQLTFIKTVSCAVSIFQIPLLKGIEIFKFHTIEKFTRTLLSRYKSWLCILHDVRQR